MRKFIVETVEGFEGFLTVKECLSIIGMGASSYYRWKTEINGCENYNFKNCLSVKPNQLSFEEQQTLIEYAKSKKFKTYSLPSLMYYCKREKIISCSLDTWSKYLKLYGVNRNEKEQKIHRNRIGIRANKPNEIWQMDITEIKYGNKRGYLQIIVDNYSRAIVGWKLSKNKKAALSEKTLNKAFEFIPEMSNYLMTDGGGENQNSRVEKILLGKGISHLIAGVDVFYSNSTVEAVFRQLKQKFITQKMNTYESLYRKVYEFIKIYNLKIPHNSLKGATPIEALRGEFCVDSFKKEDEKFKNLLNERRRIEYKRCRTCRNDFLRNFS